MMTYNETVNLIMSSRRFGKRYGVDVCRDMLDKLGHPEEGMKIIHIAGTNGKGSTASYISSMLEAAGFKVGKFTSPHLVDFTERITINSNQISRQDVIRYAEIILRKATDISDCRNNTQEPDLSMFDYCFLMAILYFRKQACDYVVLECGLGGTYDSTNAVSNTPLLSVITNIGLDHTSILGDNLTDIARNKAGIVRDDSHLVLAKMPDEARDSILKEIGPDVDLVDSTSGAYRHYRDLATCQGLEGYQLDNATSALAAIDWLSSLDGDFLYKNKPAGQLEYGYLEAIIIEGLKACNWKGRLCNISELVSEKLHCKTSDIFLDGAHNPQGVEAFRDYLLSQDYDKYIFIVGMLEDKDFNTMIAGMGDLAHCFIPMDIDSDRSLSQAQLIEMIQGAGFKTHEANDLGEALKVACQISQQTNDSNDKIAVAVYGSLYFVGSVYEYLEG